MCAGGGLMQWCSLMRWRRLTQTYSTSSCRQASSHSFLPVLELCPRACKPKVARCIHSSEEHSSFRMPQLSSSLPQLACRHAQHHDRLPDSTALPSLTLWKCGTFSASTLFAIPAIASLYYSRILSILQASCLSSKLTLASQGLFGMVKM